MIEITKNVIVSHNYGKIIKMIKLHSKIKSKRQIIRVYEADDNSDIICV